MVALASNPSETSTWNILDGFPKLHSRAREVITARCTEAPHSKSLSRVEIWQLIYEGCDGLEFFTRDPIGYLDDLLLYQYVHGHALSSMDPLGLSESSCCASWDRRSTVLGYPFDKVGAMECILNKFASMGTLNGRIAGILASLGISTAAQLARAISSGTLGARLGQIGIIVSVLQTTKLMHDFGEAGNWCRADVCTKFVDKIDRSYFIGYQCIGFPYYWKECPAGSTEVWLNGDGEAVRDPLVPVVLPDPQPGDPPLVWPPPKK